MFLNCRLSRPLSVLAAALAFTSAVPAAAAPPTAADPLYAAGRILLEPRAGLPQQELAALVGTFHGTLARKFGQSNVYLVTLPPQVAEAAVVAQLAHHPHLKFAELDRRVDAALVPTDPYYGSQWHLAKIRAATAWDTTQGSGVTIAILDSGVYGGHPDLAANMVPGWNFYDNNADTADVHGHGTAVAGAAAAAGNNGIGVAAVAGQAKIMPVRIASPTAYAYWSTVAQGLTYAADHGARVANISYVGVAASAAVQSAAQYMKNKGGLVVVCAGNNGIDEHITPTTTMIPVSATDSTDARTSWSSYGSFVALAAPGAAIWTTNKAGSYSAWNGTSFASPIVAGTAALMMAARPAMAATQVESLLYGSAVDLGAAGRDPLFGYGRVDAQAAVAAAVAAAPPADTAPPTLAISQPAANSTVSGVVAVNVAAQDNTAVARVELRANGSLVAIDTAAPFGFSWDSRNVPNGMVTLQASAFDGAGNAASQSVSVNVANASVVTGPDTTAPTVRIVNPLAGSVSGTVTVTVNAADNLGAAQLTQFLYIDGVRKAVASGGALAYNWNTSPIARGSHTLQAIAIDAAGNSSMAVVVVNR